MDEDLEMLPPDQITSGAEEEEESGPCDEEFYEMIEAPKFVDFTAPERRRPDEDRYWFCMRVGCDRKHEEEIDPEEIYKNFVLRVMAARSPNVRFRKALDRKALSTNLKCPQTCPPKPTRARASRLEMIPSISQKIVGAKVKTKPPTKLSATPNVKANMEDVGGKALTTPRNRKQRVSNPRPFQSVRKPKELDVGVPKNNKVVAKALVFHSPRKVVRLKASLELRTSLRKICSGMKKLEITCQRKQVLGCNKPLPSDASRKKLAGREVKSRVFDSLRCKGQEVKSSRCLKGGGESKKKDDSSDMETDEKSRNGSLDVHASGTCKNNTRLTTLKTLETLSENSAETMSDKSGSKGSGDNETSNCHVDDRNIEKNCDEAKISGSEEENIREVIDADDHHNKENDDKENASAPDANRISQDPNQGQAKSKFLGKNKNSKCTQKVIQVSGKTVKDAATCAATGVQVVKYRKPKPTNPKPFRLRTDERRILKDANMEKKLHLTPLKEITPVAKISRRKQVDKQHGSEKESDRTRKDQPLRTLVQDKPAKRTKSPLMKQKPARTQGFSSSGKEEKSARTMLKHKKATTKPSDRDDVSAAKASSSSRRKRPTIPKEPNFHGINASKNCTKEIC